MRGDSEKVFMWTFKGVEVFPSQIGMEGILEEIKKHQQRHECRKIRDLFGDEGVNKFEIK